jgi:hypothetical protein
MESVAQKKKLGRPKGGPVVTLCCDHCGSNYHKLKRHIRKPSKSTAFWTGKNFCCRKCSDEYRQKHAGKTSPVRHCLGCGNQVLRNHRGYGELRIRKGDSGKYCSKRCYGDHKIAMNQQKASMFLDVGTLLVWEYKRQTMLKADCYLQSTQLLNLAAPILWLPEIKQKTFDRSLVILKRNYKKRFNAACKALKVDRRVTNDCVRCGCKFKTIKPSVDMCERCRAMVYKKQQRHHKRCEAKGLPYDPSVTMEFIGERANWKCEICGKQCLKHFKWLPVGDNLYGEVHGMSPTQDHIVPLNHPENWTHGHTAENTQLACFQCNSVDKNMDTTHEMISSSHPRAKLGLPPDGVVDQY